MSELPAVVQRFLRYVKIDTRSAEDSEDYPSTPGQKVLGALLVQELRALGLADAAMDEHGVVMATLEGNAARAPTIGLIAHVDTSPEVSGRDVAPRLHPAYDGGPIPLNQYVLTPEDSPHLRDHLGHTIITSDGTTLLGADDKAGVAEIMTLLERLVADPKIPRGRLRIAFTPDEEVGAGTRHFDVAKFGAELAYTVDGETAGEIENETFCADSATVVLTGVNVHPGTAKGRMVNAIRAAARFVELLPRDRAPETTEGRQGFLHPLAVSGGVERATVKLILRDFEEDALRAQRDVLAAIAAQVAREMPRLHVDVSYEESYRNMRFVLDRYPLVVKNALEAVRRAGLEPCLSPIRGGTDGARLSFQGLPTPNVFTGGHMFHSRAEWIAVEDMQAAVDTLVQLVRIWAGG